MPPAGPDSDGEERSVIRADRQRHSAVTTVAAAARHILLCSVASLDQDWCRQRQLLQPVAQRRVACDITPQLERP